MTTAQFPLISISGSPFERGVQYGRAAASRVRASAQLYGGKLDEIGLGQDEKTALVEGCLEQIAAFDSSHVEEMKGIAEGAEVDLAGIVTINARTEIVAKAQLDKQERGRATADEGCTGAAILPERSSTGQLIHGQNWDWRAECAETGIILKVQRDDGPDILTFVEAGALARSGLNSAGISITGNYLESDLDNRGLGIPIVCIRRKVLEQQHLSDALNVVAMTAKTCSSNMIVASAEGFALNFECAPDESFKLYPENGIIAHANHFVSPVALSKLKDLGIGRFPDTLYRDFRVRQLLEAAGAKVSPADFKAAFSDDFGTPFSVCRPRGRTSGGEMLATVASIIMNPTEGYMEVARMPAEGGAFARYSIRASEVLAAAE